MSDWRETFERFHDICNQEEARVIGMAAKAAAIKVEADVYVRVRPTRDICNQDETEPMRHPDPELSAALVNAGETLRGENRMSEDSIRTLIDRAIAGPTGPAEAAKAVSHAWSKTDGSYDAQVITVEVRPGVHEVTDSFLRHLLAKDGWR